MNIGRAWKGPQSRPSSIGSVSDSEFDCLAESNLQIPGVVQMEQ